MNSLNNYILEKLKITKDTKINKNDNIKITPDTEEYKGVKFIEQYKDHSKNDFKRYGSISLDSAYEIAQIIIDNCEKELQGYYFVLYYSGYSGFVILNPNFDGENSEKYKEGIIAFYAGANKSGYKVVFTQTNSSDTTIKLKDFIGSEKDKFNI